MHLESLRVRHRRRLCLRSPGCDGLGFTENSAAGLPNFRFPFLAFDYLISGKFSGNKYKFPFFPKLAALALTGIGSSSMWRTTPIPRCSVVTVSHCVRLPAPSLFVCLFVHGTGRPVSATVTTLSQAASLSPLPVHIATYWNASPLTAGGLV